jgi:hypothetical protein
MLDESQWSRALAYLAERGEDVDALLARASDNLERCRNHPEPFPAEALIKSERSFQEAT